MESLNLIESNGNLMMTAEKETCIPQNNHVIHKTLLWQENLKEMAF